MSSVGFFSSQRNEHRNTNANAGTTMKRRNNNRGYGDFQEKRSRYSPPQKRSRLQSQSQPQFRSDRILPPLYHGRSNVSRDYRSYNYGDVIDSNSRNSFPFNDFSASNIDYQKPIGYENPNPQIVPLPLPYRKLDVSCDSLPEWVPNESVSRTLTPNFPITSNFVHNANAQEPVFTNFSKSLPLDRSNMVSIASQSLPLNNSNMVSMSQPIFESKDLSYLLSILSNEKEKQNSEASKSDELPSGLSFDNPMSLRVRHESVIKSLYSDMPRQCTSCGLRFKCQEDHSNHMDWHVRKNRMAKTTTRQSQSQKSRDWFASTTLWLSAATTGGTLEAAKASFGDSKKQKEEETEQEHLVLADENHKMCALCEEPFEDFFSHETDDWMYKDAVYLSKNGPIVHAKCKPEN